MAYYFYLVKKTYKNPTLVLLHTTLPILNRFCECDVRDGGTFLMFPMLKGHTVLTSSEVHTPFLELHVVGMIIYRVSIGE